MCLLYKAKWGLRQIIIIATMIIEIANINYKASLLEPIDPALYRRRPPTMATIWVPEYKCKVIIFKSGKCRIMGLKREISQTCIDAKFPVKLKLGSIMSCTRTIDFQTGLLNLPQIRSRLGVKAAMYEPELFPALRLIRFSPLCINVFHTGKCVITGLKSTNINWDLIFQIRNSLQ